MKTIPDFAVSSQEAGFDKFLKVYNEYFKFDFFGNAKFYGAKNGENYQTGQAWITPITPSQAIALLTNQTTDKMNTLANSCFQYDGSDDSKNIIRIMNKNHRGNFTGNDKYFYWIANDIADTFYKMDKDLTEIPPYEYLALLTGKQLTEGDLIVGNRFECIEDIINGREGVSFTKGEKYKCELDKSITNNFGYPQYTFKDSEYLNRHFKLLPTQESVKGEDESIGFKKYLLELIPIQTYAHDFPQNFSAREIIKMADKYSTQQTAHLQQQLKKANLLLLNIKNTIELNNIQKVFPETYPQINQFLSRH